MSFLRHRRSFHPMGKGQTGRGLGAHSRLSSARMSRSRLFLGGSVSTGARFCFIGCAQNAVQWSCRSSNLQRTAYSVLFGCLSQGVHPKIATPFGAHRDCGKWENNTAGYGRIRTDRQIARGKHRKEDGWWRRLRIADRRPCRRRRRSSDRGGRRRRRGGRFRNDHKGRPGQGAKRDLDRFHAGAGSLDTNAPELILRDVYLNS